MFSLAHEFKAASKREKSYARIGSSEREQARALVKSTDAMRKAIERHAFPWPCLVDLDDEFGVFRKHGTQNSALFLIDCNGTIIAVPNSVEELKAKLEEIFPNNK